ncbi:DNA-binding transcriptional regulator, PadR family [Nocardioides exalbidus]|uniref:DNA-binding transcriptional regulator, PadR family n=1 Tax=Nocardioides exalbidus TaxID=402596 RepID=A0A1H4U1A4_9ACTN|nr:PadR family transcriptional regulator [Nocardioides exalbidus]SEC62310.1 DNA-binding transcriptional regulator, PadR family [Nocardioides exalbidus]
MSIRHGLLALLERGPGYGYQLRADFDAVTADAWPLNIGQVYSTLSRLERDGLVEPAGQDEQGRARYAITGAGRAELLDWFASAVTAQDRPRDELSIKLALAVTVPGVDVAALIQHQRAATIGRLQDLTRLKSQGEPGEEPGGLAWSLVLENLRYAAEAEVRWLDHCEAMVARAAKRGAPAHAAAPAKDRATTGKGARR